MRNLKFHMAAILCALVSMASAGIAAASTPAEKTSAALDQLESWLHSSKYAPAWNAYLKTDELQAQLAKPKEADLGVLLGVLKQYRGSATGLQMRQYAAVRRALKAWIDEVTRRSLPSVDQLPALAEKLDEQLSPKTTTDVADAASVLQRDMRHLGHFLDANGRRGQNWKTFLKWNQLQSALAAKEPSLAALKEVLDRFDADEDGLEMAPYTAVRRSLRDYLYTSLAARNPSVVSAQLEKYDHLLPRQPKFDALLRGYGSESSHAAAVGIGARLGELSKFHDAPLLVEAVRHYWSHPNLSGYARRDLVAAALDEKLDEVVNIQEDILGTYITGSGKLKGEVQLVLVPDEHRAVLLNVMHGTTHTNTTGFNGPVEIYSSGVTKLSGTKQITISRHGLGQSPATGTATTANNVDGVSTRRNGPLGKMIQRVAWKKIGEQKDKAEQKAAELAAEQLKQRMNRQASESLDKANHDFAYKFHDPLVRHDAFPHLLNVSSTENAIHIVWQQAAADQLAAPTPAEPLQQQNDLGVRLHESLLNNLAASNLGGRTITDQSESKTGEDAERIKKFKEKIKKQKERNREERFAKMSDEEKKVEMARREKADREQKFSITLARLNPVTTEFRGGTIKVTIRGTEFVGFDEKKYDKFPMSIWVVYHLRRSDDGGLELQIKDLDKDWGVMTTEEEFGGPAAVGAEALRSKLKARFGDLFVDLYRIELEPLVLSGKLERVGKLAFKQADAQAGWLTLAWDRMTTTSDKSAGQAAPSKLPALKAGQASGTKVAVKSSSRVAERATPITARSARSR